MTATPPPPGVATGLRRAGALVLHHQARDVLGVNTVLRELESVDDTGRLIFSLLDLFDAFLPYSDVGRDVVRELLAELAGLEQPGSAE